MVTVRPALYSGYVSGQAGDRTKRTGGVATTGRTGYDRVRLAASMSMVIEVAPGSWCPALRSPK